MIMLQLLSSVLLTQSHISAGAGLGEADVLLLELASDILQRMPPPFNEAEVSEKYPVLYKQSMNTVLRQVCSDSLS